MMLSDRNFCFREDLEQYLKMPVATRVSHKFTSSFDAEAGGYILHFTAQEGAMTPLSVLLPEDLIAEIQSGWQILLQPESLAIGMYDLSPSPLLERVQPPLQIDHEVLHGNLLQLRSNLELFGRSSPVLDMVLQRRRRPDPLAAAAERLSADVADLSGFVAFFGVGEGLTPSFDDFMAGMLFVDRFFGFDRLVVTENLWELAAARTTRQAVQQYRFAENGQFSRQFEQVAANLTQRQVGAAELVRLMGWGHSSGTDILCGIWYYFSHQVKIDVKI